MVKLKDKDELKVVVPLGEVTTTKRGILSKLARIYYPIGLLSPRTLQGKIIYREVCEKKISLDAPLSAEQKNDWLKADFQSSHEAPRSSLRVMYDHFHPITMLNSSF